MRRKKAVTSFFFEVIGGLDIFHHIGFMHCYAAHRLNTANQVKATRAF